MKSAQFFSLVGRGASPGDFCFGRTRNDLVGGLEHEIILPYMYIYIYTIIYIIYWDFHHPNWRPYLFSEGWRKTTTAMGSMGSMGSMGPMGPGIGKVCNRRWLPRYQKRDPVDWWRTWVIRYLSQLCMYLHIIIYIYNIHTYISCTYIISYIYIYYMHAYNLQKSIYVLLYFFQRGIPK